MLFKKVISGLLAVSIALVGVGCSRKQREKQSSEDAVTRSRREINRETRMTSSSAETTEETEIMYTIPDLGIYETEPYIMPGVFDFSSLDMTDEECLEMFMGGALAGDYESSVLNLSFNQLSDLQYFSAEFGFLNGIGLLDLSYNQIYDVTPLKSLNDLIYLDLSGNPLTQEQVYELSKELPYCLVIFEPGPEEPTSTLDSSSEFLLTDLNPLGQSKNIFFDQWIHEQYLGPFIDGGKTAFSSGIGMFSDNDYDSGQGWIEYPLNNAYRIFSVHLAIDLNWCGGEDYGSSECKIYIDEVEVFNTILMKSEAAEWIEIDIPADSKILRLEINQKAGVMGTQSVFWGNPGFN